MTAFSMVVILFAAVATLLGFWFLGFFSAYETPVSLGDALRRYGKGALMGSVTATAWNVGQFGLAILKWYWSWTGAIVVVCAAMMLFDWLMVRHERKRTKI